MRKRQFKSLDKIEYALEYFQEFLARVSSTLLMIGLVVSMMNFLLDDAVFRGAHWTEVAWALFQALAVDANLSVVFALSIEAHQNKQRPLVVLYVILGVFLVFVAVIVTNTEALRQALGLKLTSAYDMSHVPLWLLTLVRSMVAVGLVAASGVSSRLRLQWQSQDQPMQATAVDGTRVEEVPVPVTPALLELRHAELPAPKHTPATSDGFALVDAYLRAHPHAKVPEIMAATSLSRSSVNRHKQKLTRHAISPSTTTTTTG